MFIDFAVFFAVFGALLGWGFVLLPESLRGLRVYLRTGFGINTLLFARLAGLIMLPLALAGAFLAAMGVYLWLSLGLLLVGFLMVSGAGFLRVGQRTFHEFDPMKVTFLELAENPDLERMVTEHLEDKFGRKPED